MFRVANHSALSWPWVHTNRSMRSSDDRGKPTFGCLKFLTWFGTQIDQIMVTYQKGLRKLTLTYQGYKNLAKNSALRSDWKLAVKKGINFDESGDITLVPVVIMLSRPRALWIIAEKLEIEWFIRSLSVDNRSLFDYGVLTCYEYDTAQKKTDNLFILLISRFDLFTGVPNTDSSATFSASNLSSKTVAKIWSSFV